MTPTISQPDTDEVKAMAERIERARKFIATEYADPSQLPKGDWISPAAKPAHDALCLVLEQLDRLSAQAQAQGSGTVKVTTIRQLADDPNSASGKSLRDVPVTHPSAGPAVREEGLPYGIIDPDYAAFFTVARLVAWSYGYGVGLHGSFTRDLDLILVPWTDRANPDPDHVLKNIESRSGWKRIKDDGSKHPHGRLVWTLTSRRFECPRFIDIGFMPLTTPDPQGPSEKKDDVQTRPQNEESRVADTSCTKSASRKQRKATFTYYDDPDAGHLYYFSPQTTTPGPYQQQRHVKAIVDIASDGSFAGVELIDNMPPLDAPAHHSDTKKG